MRWTWDPDKDLKNRRKHKLSFGLAQRVFDDPLAASRLDSFAGEERWQTIGMIGPVCVFVIHTSPDMDRATGAVVGRIISARKATDDERKAFEEGWF